MGGDEAGLEFKQSRAGALSLSATLHGHLRLPQKSEGGAELAKGRGAERAWGGVGGGSGRLPATPPGGPSCARRARELASDRGSVGCRFRGEVAKDRAPLPPCPPLCLLWRRGTAARRLRATGHQPVRPSPGYRCGDAWEPILPPQSAGVTLALADAVAAAS